jgi:hypothetical protein
LAEAKAKNPYLKDEFSQGGGGGWSGKVVTVTAASFVRRPWKRADGSPVLNNKTNDPVITTNLSIRGIADGQSAEITREWEVPFLLPTEDGEGLYDPKRADGTFKIKASSEVAKFLDAYQTGGGSLDAIVTVDSDKVVQHISGLVGAKILFRGEPQLDKDGTPRLDKNKFPVLSFFPEEVVTQGQGRGAAAADDTETKAEAATVVAKLLADAPEHRISRQNFMQQAAKAVKGRANSNAVLKHLLDNSFLSTIPNVNYNGSELSVS